MASAPSVYHELLRPSILQILRATGYHSTRPAVLDSITDLAARYMLRLCENTASHAGHNHGDAADFDVADVRLALQDTGALLPATVSTEEFWRGEEDLRDVEDFLNWFSGHRMKELMEIGSGDGESDATDYLSSLKRRHGKTADDARYLGTILGKQIDISEIQVEGGPVASIDEWIANRTPQGPTRNGQHSPAPSSGLSSLGDRISDDDDDDDEDDDVPLRASRPNPQNNTKNKGGDAMDLS